MTGRISDPDRLIALAHDKSEGGRAALVNAITGLYSAEDEDLTDRDRELMDDILRDLVRDVEQSVRKQLAQHFAQDPHAPAGLLVTLANDQIEVAHPILANSEVLKDAELIEVVKHRTMEHQVAVALRPHVSERLSDALVETEDESVITALLSNNGAVISRETLDQLTVLARRIGVYRKPLVHRHDLTPDLAKRLYWCVSAALRQHILDQFELDPDELDESIETAVKDAITRETRSIRRKSVGKERPAKPEDGRQHALMKLLEQGEIPSFLDHLTKLCGLRIGLVRRILFEGGGENLAAVCKVAGLDKHAFITIFLRFRQGRLGDPCASDEELNRAIAFFEEIEIDAARMLLRRWRKDPDYLNALKMVGQR